jgi:MFS family permease
MGTFEVTRMYFGWYILVISGLIYTILIGITLSSFGFFVIPVSTDMNLSRADMNTGYILLTIGSAIQAPFIGRAVDRFPTKRILLGSVILLGLTLALLGLSHSLVLSGFVMASLLPGAFLGITLPVSIFLTRWFVVHRAKALMLAMLGMSFGAVAVAPIVAWLIERAGWRASLLIVAGAASTILMVLASLIRERPGIDDVEPGRTASPTAQAVADGPAPPPVGLVGLLRRSQFWIIAVSCSVPMAIGQTIVLTMVPLALQRGLTTVQAAGLVSINGAAAVGGSLLISMIADRIDRVVLLACFFVLGAFTSVMLLVNGGYASLLGAAVTLGVSGGSLAPLFYALLADRFGLASFGTVSGLVTPINAVISAVFVRLAGEIFDHTGEYGTLFQILIAAQLGATLLVWTCRTSGRANTTPQRPAAIP